MDWSALGRIWERVRCSPTIRLSIFIGLTLLVLPSYSDPPDSDELEKYGAFLIDEDSPYAKQFEKLYQSVWETVLKQVKQAQGELQPEERISVNFDELKKSPPKLHLLTSSLPHLTYHKSKVLGQEIQFGKGTIVLSTAMVDYQNNDPARVAYLLAHELTHELQGFFQKTAGRMLGEQMADRMALRTIHSMGFDPKAALKVADSFEAIEGFYESRDLLSDLRKMIDEHNLAHIRRLQSEDELAKLPKPNKKAEFAPFNPKLKRQADYPGIKEGMKKLWAFVRKASSEEIFSDTGKRKFLELAADIFARDPQLFGNEKGAFQRGLIQPIFEVFDYLGQHKAKSGEDLGAVLKLLEAVAKHESFDKSFVKYLKGFYFNLSSIFRKHRIPRSYSSTHHHSDSLDYSVGKLVRSLLSRYLRLDSVQKKLSEIGEKGDNAHLVIHKTLDEFFSKTDLDSFLGDGSQSGRFLNQVVQARLEQLAKLDLPEKKMLEQVQAIAKASLINFMELENDSEISSSKIFKNKEHLRKLYGEAFSPESMKHFRTLWSQFKKKNKDSVKQSQFYKALVVAIAPGQSHPILARMNFEAELDSWLSNQLTMFSDKHLSLVIDRRISEIEDRLSDFGGSPYLRATRRDELLSLLKEVKQLIGADSGIPETVKALKELERAMGEVAEGKSLSRTRYPLMFSLFVKPDVDSLSSPGLPPQLIEFLKERKLTPPGLLCRDSCAKSTQTDSLFVLRDEHHRQLFQGTSGVSILAPPDRFLNAARAQLEILKNYLEKKPLWIPSGKVKEEPYELGELDSVRVRRYEVDTEDEKSHSKGASLLEQIFSDPKNRKLDFILPAGQSGDSERLVAIAMVEHLLDYYAGAASEGARYNERAGRELEVILELAPEVAKALSFKVLQKKITGAGKARLVHILIEGELPNWKILDDQRARQSHAVWALLGDDAELAREVVFRHGLEAVQKAAIDRLKELKEFPSSFEKKMQLYEKLSANRGGSAWLDAEILSAMKRAGDEEIGKYLQSSDKAKEFLKEQLFSPTSRIEIAAHILRGISDPEAKAKLLKEIVPLPQAYYQAWSMHLGDGMVKGFASQKIDKKLFEQIEKHVPKRGESEGSGRTVEFFERLYHGLDVALQRLSNEEIGGFVKYLSQKNRGKLSTGMSKNIRLALSYIFPGKISEGELELEVARFYDSLEPQQKQFFLYQMFVRHPTFLESDYYQKEFAKSPLFSQETHASLEEIKKLVWKNMTHREKAMASALMFHEGKLKGSLTESEDFIVKVLELLGVTGRKLAQLLSVHGHFISDSLRAKLKVFRDSNVHTDRIQIIQEFERLFRRELGLSFWDEVKEVKDILGAGSLKTAIHVVLKDGKEVVIKLVDPVVRDQTIRNIELAKESLEEWSYGSGKKKSERGILLYLLRRLEHAVRTESDLAKETENTKKHADNIRARRGPSTPVCLVERLCSSSLNTVEYLSHRGNANQVPTTAAESDRIVDEILSQLLVDRFLHGDLQNRANILALIDRPPAFIDLSLSEKVNDADIKLLMRFGMTLSALKTSSDFLHSFIDVLQNHHGISAARVAAKLHEMAQESKNDHLVKISLEDWKKVVSLAKKGKFLSAFDLIATDDLKSTLADATKMLKVTIAPLAGNRTKIETKLDELIGDLWKSVFSSKDGFQLSELILLMEKRGLVFEDRFMFLLENMALALSEQERALELAGESKDKAYETLFAKILTKLQPEHHEALDKDVDQLIADCHGIFEKRG